MVVPLIWWFQFTQTLSFIHLGGRRCTFLGNNKYNTESKIGRYIVRNLYIFWTN